MPVTHHSVFYRPDALPAAQPTASSTEGTTSQQVTRLKTNVTAVTFCEKEAQFADEKSDIDGAK